MQKRLDRCLISQTLKRIFYPKMLIRHLARIASDYTPLLIQGSKMYFRRQNRVKPFGFEAIWLHSSECEEVVRQA